MNEEIFRTSFQFYMDDENGLESKTFIQTRSAVELLHAILTMSKETAAVIIHEIWRIGRDDVLYELFRETANVDASGLESKLEVLPGKRIYMNTAEVLGIIRQGVLAMLQISAAIPEEESDISDPLLFLYDCLEIKYKVANKLNNEDELSPKQIEEVRSQMFGQIMTLRTLDARLMNYCESLAYQMSKMI